MNLLSLDVSTSTGWALFVSEKLQEYGLISCKDSKIDYKKFSGNSLIAMLKAVNKLASEVVKLIDQYKIDTVVIEQTNKGRSRHVQKMLEWLHFGIIVAVHNKMNKYPEYLDSSEWRQLVNLKMSKEDVKHNKLIRATKKRGKIGKKHLAVRMVNEMYKLKFKMKDNDKADAILLGTAFLKKLNENCIMDKAEVKNEGK